MQMLDRHIWRSMISLSAKLRLYITFIYFRYFVWSRDMVHNQRHREENWCLWPMVSSAHPEHYLVGACNESVVVLDSLLSDTVRTRRLELFGHVARADKSQDHSRALQACISLTPRNWRRRPGRPRPRHKWLRTVEEDLRQFNLGLKSGLRIGAQNRTTWRTLTGTATSPTGCDWWWWWYLRKLLTDLNHIMWNDRCWAREDLIGSCACWAREDLIGSCACCRFCNGCKLECSPQLLNASTCYLAVDWEPTALHLRYHASQEKVRTLTSRSVRMCRMYMY